MKDLIPPRWVRAESQKAGWSVNVPHGEESREQGCIAPTKVCLAQGTMTWRDFENVVLFDKIVKNKEEADTYQIGDFYKGFGTVS